jgi:peptide/nickel transport system permease protein
MVRYIIGRILIALVLIVLLSMMSFFIIQLPASDFAELYVRSQGGLARTEDEIQREAQKMRELYDMDGTVPEQYIAWVEGIITRGDFGQSISGFRPVSRIIAERLPITIMIGLLVLLFQYVVAVPIAIISAVKQYSKLDHGLTFISFTGMSIPEFLLAIVLTVVLFNLSDKAWPIAGLQSPEFQGDTPWTWEKIVDLLQHLVVPIIVVGTASTAGTVRILRATMLDELGKEYMRTARAKGLPEWRLILKYPLRIAVNPILASVGLSLPVIVSGTVIISLVLDIPDIGPVLFDALVNQDVYLAGTIVFILSCLTIFGTMISDILLAISDPRIDLTERK